LEDKIIDSDRVAGPANKNKCAGKQVAGKAVDDAKLEPNGEAGKLDRNVQSYLAILDLMPGRRECAILLKPAARPL
jgi:uncharacterized protein YjbJ (UPF0337 family)